MFVKALKEKILARTKAENVHLVKLLKDVQNAKEDEEEEMEEARLLGNTWQPRAVLIIESPVKKSFIRLSERSKRSVKSYKRRLGEDCRINSERSTLYDDLLSCETSFTSKKFCFDVGFL